METHASNQDRACSAPNAERKASDAKGSVFTWIGRVLMLLGLIFVGLRFWSYRYSVGSELANPVLLFTTVLFSVIYAASCLLLALGWWLILHARIQQETRLPWRAAWRIYGKTQIAKYIPGNIFHFAGRHVLSAQEGISHSRLVMAATLEIIMMLLATGLISLLAVRSVIDSLRYFNSYASLIAGVGVVVAGSVALFYVARRFDAKNLLAALRLRWLLGAQSSYLLFFLISAGLFFCLLKVGAVGWSASYWPAVFESYAVAWAIGFVIPGAPGGLGVREAILVALLSSLLPEKTVLVSALLFRVVTTFGDILFFSGSVNSWLHRAISPALVLALTLVLECVT